MKEIKKRKSFLKSFKNLPPKIQVLAIEKLSLFFEDNSSPELQDHALKGNMKGQRAFSVNWDYRITYREENDRIILLNIGKHAKIYKKF